MANKKIDLNLRSVDEINEAAEKMSGVDAILTPDAGAAGVVNIPLSRIDPFPDHPYHVADDAEMRKLAASIEENGLILPVVVRKVRGGRYELISGHRRKRACELAGFKEIKAVVKRIKDDEAAILMVDSNLHREHLLPSEKAWAYRIKADALKRSGRRTDLSGEGRYSSKAEAGRGSGDTEKTVARYIRLTFLDKRLLDMVDSGRLKFVAGVELSYLDTMSQKLLLDVMEDMGAVPNLAQAKRLKLLCRHGAPEMDEIEAVLHKPRKEDSIPAIDMKKLLRALPAYVSHGEEEEWILAAICHYAAASDKN